MLLECRRGSSHKVSHIGRWTSSFYKRIKTSSSTNFLKLELIHDDEAVSVSRPLNSSTVILAFSVEHYSELILRDIEAKEDVRVV